MQGESSLDLHKPAAASRLDSIRHAPQPSEPAALKLQLQRSGGSPVQVCVWSCSGQGLETICGQQHQRAAARGQPRSDVGRASHLLCGGAPSLCADKDGGVRGSYAAARLLTGQPAGPVWPCPWLSLSPGAGRTLPHAEPWQRMARQWETETETCRLHVAAAAPDLCGAAAQLNQAPCQRQSRCTPLTVAARCCQGFVSGPDHKGKKSSLVLFINGRLVECSPLKRGLDNTYAAIYPRTYCPFIFLVRFLLGSIVLAAARRTLPPARSIVWYALSVDMVPVHPGRCTGISTLKAKRDKAASHSSISSLHMVWRAHILAGASWSAGAGPAPARRPRGRQHAPHEARGRLPAPGRADPGCLLCCGGPAAGQ